MNKRFEQNSVFSTNFKRGLIGLLFFGLGGCSTPNINRVSLGPFVSYSRKVTNSLIHIYEGKVFEMPVCLVGSREGDFYRISDIEIPFIYTVGKSEALYSECGEGTGKVNDYVGMVHRHLNNNCVPSEIDMKRFFMEEQAKIEAIICEMNFPYTIRIETYIKENLPEHILDYYRELASREESEN